MSPIRLRDEEPSLGSVLASLAIGALAGFAVGVVVAQKSGGLAGLASRLRRRVAELEEEAEEREPYHRHTAYEEEEAAEEFGAETARLEERVLEAFQGDPVLRERAIDIGAIGEGVIELTGWVEREAEIRRATEVAQRVPGVDSVVNRLAVGEPDDARADDEALDSLAAGDESEPIPGGRWEGQRVGTGRRRQGTSDEPDRHADPRPDLEARWLDEQHALRDAAGAVGDVGERRQRRRKPPAGDRAQGGPIAPGGVPKADHVANPEEAPEA
jgi:hypothetical protein